MKSLESTGDIKEVLSGYRELMAKWRDVGFDDSQKDVKWNRDSLHICILKSPTPYPHVEYKVTKASRL